MVKSGLFIPVGYDCVIIKDLPDVDDRLRGNMTGAHFVGARKASPKGIEEDIRIISVKFTKVGKGTLDRFPNLRYIVCRSHGVDNVDVEAATKRGVKVVTTSPNAHNCAAYILHFYDKYSDPRKPITLFGYGAIAKAFENIGIRPRVKVNYIRSDTSFDEAKELLKGEQTLVITAPLTDRTKGYINGGLLQHFAGNIISIARGKLFNCRDIMLLLQTKQLDHVVMDIIPEAHQEEMMANGVIYTEHQAWNFGGFDRSTYNAQLVSIIDEMLAEINGGLI